MTAPAQKIPLIFRILHIFENWLAQQSLCPQTEFPAAEHFPWTTALESNWEVIYREMQQVATRYDDIPPFQEISHMQRSITKDSRWRTHFLFAYGLPVAKHCRDCPETARILRAIPGMKTAMFSCLEPGKTIPVHRGPYRGLLRAHLGLEIPSHNAEACGIEINGHRRNWVAGQTLIFDDTYLHSAWNKTAARRIVLFIDFERPLKPVARLLNRLLLKAAVLSPYGRKAVRDFRQWYQDKGLSID